MDKPNGVELQVSSEFGFNNLKILSLDKDGHRGEKKLMFRKFCARGGQGEWKLVFFATRLQTFVLLLNKRDFYQLKTAFFD